MSALAAGLAFLSASAAAVATSLQHRAAQQAPADRPGTLALMRHLVRQRPWLFGQVLSVTGLVLHAAALHNGPIALVQPIIISAVVLAVIVRSGLSRRWPWPREVLAVALAAAGLATFLVVSDPSPGTGGPLPAPALVICVAAAVLALAAGWLSRHAPTATQSAFLLGIGSGVLFGAVAGLMKAVTYVALTAGPLVALSSWLTWALVLLGGSAIINNQLAYRRARLSASMPVLNVVDCAVALLFGVVAFREVPQHTAGAVVVQLLAFAAIAGGLFVVARLEEERTQAAEPSTLDLSAR